MAAILSALPPNVLQNSADEWSTPKSGQYQNLKRRFCESKFPIQGLIQKIVLRARAQNSFATHSPRKQTFVSAISMSALCHFRTKCIAAKPTYSITVSAVVSNIGGTARPSALAVFKLMASSNLVGCSTGISPGFVPRKILSTISAARRNRLSIFGP